MRTNARKAAIGMRAREVMAVGGVRKFAAGFVITPQLGRKQTGAAPWNHARHSFRVSGRPTGAAVASDVRYGAIRVNSRSRTFPYSDDRSRCHLLQGSRSA